MKVIKCDRCGYEEKLEVGTQETKILPIRILSGGTNGTDYDLCENCLEGLSKYLKNESVKR